MLKQGQIGVNLSPCNMFLFVFGEHVDEVIAKEQSLVRAFKQKHDPNGYNIDVVDVSSDKLFAENILRHMKDPAFMASARLIVIRSLLTETRASDIKLLLHEYLKKNDQVFILFRDIAPEKKIITHKLFTTLSSSSIAVHAYHYPSLKHGELEKWALERANQLGLIIDVRSVAKLRELCADDIGRVGMELNRLKAYFQNNAVDASLLDTLIPQNFEQAIFSFTELLASRNVAQISNILQHQIIAGLSFQGLFSMMARQIRLWIQISANERSATKLTPQELDLHPFTYKKTLADIKQFSASDLVHLHEELFVLESKMKHGNISAEGAVHALIMALSSNNY